MKTNFTSQSAFFVLRVLIGLGGIFLALLGVGAFSNAFAQGKAKAPPGVLVPASTMVTGAHAAVNRALNIAGSRQSQLIVPAAGSPAESMWTLGTAYPTTIVRYGWAQTATHFYVFGGVSDGTQVNNVNRMDIATGMWEPRAAMPFTSEAPTCALMESTSIVYCAQGDTGSGFAAYNIATDTWTTLASDPFVTDHYGSASGAFNGKVFVGGGSAKDFRNAVQVYDVATDTWSAGTAAPSVFLFAGYQQVGQFLYVVGGFDSTFVNNATTWRLDMSSAPGVWETGPAFTPQRADFGLAYDAGTSSLYALAGDLPNDGNPFNSTNLVDELNVGSWPGGTWTSSPPDLPTPNRQANQAGFFGGGDIWSVGGINGSTFQFFADVYHRNNEGGGGEITLAAKLRRQQGQRLVALSWSPANGGSVNVVRDGVLIHTTDDDGRAQDRVGARESHTYQVCETDTGTCSNEVTIQIP
jgi:hypothetical protein